jgi:hypothetical protein
MLLSSSGSPESYQQGPNKNKEQVNNRIKDRNKKTYITSHIVSLCPNTRQSKQRFLAEKSNELIWFYCSFVNNTKTGQYEPK